MTSKSNESNNAMSDEVSIRVVASTLLAHEGGLHARPSIKVIQLAKRFQSKVWLAASEEGPWTDAKSIAQVIAMKIPVQTRVFFSAEGDDANDAVDALVSLVDSDFGNNGTANGAPHAQ